LENIFPVFGRHRKSIIFPLILNSYINQNFHL
jgi:hypothetical protein